MLEIITEGVTMCYKTTMAHHGPGVRAQCTGIVSDHYLGLLVLLARVRAVGIEVEVGL